MLTGGSGSFALADIVMHWSGSPPRLCDLLKGGVGDVVTVVAFNLNLPLFIYIWFRRYLIWPAIYIKNPTASYNYSVSASAEPSTCKLSPLTGMVGPTISHYHLTTCKHTQAIKWLCHPSFFFSPVRFSSPFVPSWAASVLIHHVWYQFLYGCLIAVNDCVPDTQSSPLQPQLLNKKRQTRWPNDKHSLQIVWQSAPQHNLNYTINKQRWLKNFLTLFCSEIIILVDYYCSGESVK